MQHDSCITYATWLVHLCRDSFICACVYDPDIYTCWHSWVRGACVRHICKMSRACVTWLVRVWNYSSLVGVLAPFAWKSRVTRMDKSCHRYECISWNIWMSHVKHVGVSCHTHEWVTWMSDITHVIESSHTYGWVMSHLWMYLMTHMNESCHRCEYVTSHILEYYIHT